MVYSLRSVWKYAPWVRNIFIITNGQVPHWLNLDNPKIKLITHQDIYKNVSHLPVFASPTIEANIHRIPGLSRRFIYLNDDVMFGNYIYPDDFWKLDGTQYFYPSWEVPRCAEGCPSNWIGDGYCDSACNSEACDFDGGDCKNGDKNKNKDDNNNNNNDKNKDKQNEEDRYCANGCPITWIGDKVCDKACQDPKCAYDGGDCGIKMLQDNDVHSIVFEEDKNNTVFELDRDIMTFYIDFDNIWPRDVKDEDKTTSLVPTASPGSDEPDTESTTSTTKHPDEGKIKSATHDHSDMVRSAIITQHDKILTVILHKHERIDDEEIVTFNIGGIIQGETVTYIFDIKRDAPPKIISKAKVETQIKDILTHVNETEVTNPNITSYKLNNETVISPLKQLWNKSMISNETINTFYLELFKFTDTHLYTFIQAIQHKKIKIEYNKWLKRESKVINDTIKALNDSKHKDTEKDSSKSDMPNLPTLAPVKVLWEDDLFEYMDPESEHYRYESGDEDWYQRRRLLGVNKPYNSKYANDNDYRIMISLGLIDYNGKWLRSKSSNEWDFIHDNTLLNSEYNDDKEYQIIIDGYMDDDQGFIKSHKLDDHKCDTMKEIKIKKEKELATLQRNELIKLNEKLTKIFQDNDMIPFPWLIEKISLFIMQKKEFKSMLHDSIDKREFKHKRRLLDTFGDSLRYVHRLYNKHFGSETRYVPAHMPHAIDKEILLELVHMFSKEFDLTSSHKFRSSKDMQWSFSYFYFMMNAKYNFTSLDFIYENYLDLDGDTYLNKFEENQLVNDILIKEADSNTANDVC